ncbi:MAG: roadblock/LC7 domain-containing protein [Xanthomonadales bacterium]|nr:roadblock/LC7 domain-containing protein [Xanthomonadales bacterium]
MTSHRMSRVSREIARKQLELLGQAAGVRSAVLFTSDGFEVAAHAADAEASARLAAIGSSLAALGSAIAGEAGLGEFERTLIESPDGTVIIQRVGSSRAMSLAAIGDRKAVLGKLLWAVQQASGQLATFLEVNRAADGAPRAQRSD